MGTKKESTTEKKAKICSKQNYVVLFPDQYFPIDIVHRCLFLLPFDSISEAAQNPEAEKIVVSLGDVEMIS